MKMLCLLVIGNKKKCNLLSLIDFELIEALDVFYLNEKLDLKILEKYYIDFITTSACETRSTLNSWKSLLPDDFLKIVLTDSTCTIYSAEKHNHKTPTLSNDLFDTCIDVEHYYPRANAEVAHRCYSDNTSRSGYSCVIRDFLSILRPDPLMCVDVADIKSLFCSNKHLRYTTLNTTLSSSLSAIKLFLFDFKYYLANTKIENLVITINCEMLTYDLFTKLSHIIYSYIDQEKIKVIIPTIGLEESHQQLAVGIYYSIEPHDQ